MTKCGGSALKEMEATKTGPRAHPLRILAQQHRLRCYRDACGDWNIRGRWGELFWYGAAHDGLPDRIGVQLGGPRANESETAVPVGSNKRINRAREVFGQPSQSGDGEGVFVVSADRIMDAARIVGAFRKRKPFTAEERARAIQRLQGIRRRSLPIASGHSFPVHPALKRGPGG